MSLTWASPGLAEWVQAARWDRVQWLAGLILLAATVYFAALLILGLRPRDFRVRGSGEGG